MSFWKKLFPEPKNTKNPFNPPEKGKDSDEPWIDVQGEVVNDQIVLKADWNDAFIVYLREHGYQGSSDEAIVQRYIAEMHQQMMAEENEQKGDGTTYV